MIATAVGFWPQGQRERRQSIIFDLKKTLLPPQAKAGFAAHRLPSLDPYMRGRMSDAPSYSPPVPIDGVMCGATISRVVRSQHNDFHEGDWVLGYSGWQDYDSGGEGLIKLGENPQHPSWSLGVLGMPGFTAYMGLLDIGQPKAGRHLSWLRLRGR
jgi:NADPH-dependent curcumin reductase CurA